MNFREIFLFIILINFDFNKSQYVSYRNYRMYKIIPRTEREALILDDAHKDGLFLLLSDVIKNGIVANILIAPEKQNYVEDYLRSVGINFKIVIDDVQEAINAQLYRPKGSRNADDYSWQYYQSYEEVYDWLDNVAEKYPEIVTLVTMGYSLEGRVIKGVKIDYKKRANSTHGMIEGTLHAREWITTATATWIVNEFLTSKDPNIRIMAENIVWHVFPITNPDGYVYSFTTNRMWRKNRNKSNFTNCIHWNMDDDISNGVDLNRNFGFLWMFSGGSLDPCSDNFSGSGPFSEPESRAIASYVKKTQEEGNLVFYYSLHSFFQIIFVPFSHRSGPNVLDNPNYADLYEIAIKGMDKLEQRYGTKYIVGTLGDLIYNVTGTSFDWVKGGAEVPIVYLIELRDDGEFGALLPPDLIIPNNEEIMDGLIEMDRVSRSLGYYHVISSATRVFNINITIFILTLLITLYKF